MKRLLNTLLICILCSGVALACPPSGSGDKASKTEISKDAGVSFASLDLDVIGMTCGGCENKVKASLAGIDGVVETKKVCSESDKASLTYDPSVTSSDEIIKQLVDKTGYEISIVKNAGVSETAAKKACCASKKGKASCSSAKKVGTEKLEKE